MSGRLQPKPQFVPPEYRCVVCGEEACFGLGWPARPDQRWYCPVHKPHDFYGDRR